jgi:hypothetical protein
VAEELLSVGTLKSVVTIRLSQFCLLCKGGNASGAVSLAVSLRFSREIVTLAPADEDASDRE